MTQRRSIPLVLLCLAGCVGPPDLDGSATDCRTALAHGVAGDPCEFFESCAETPSSSGAPGPGEMNALCLAGTLVLQRTTQLRLPFDGAHAFGDDCVIVGTRIGTPLQICVADDLLPAAASIPTVELDGGDACQDVLTSGARAGDPCVGQTMCGVVESARLYHPMLDPGVYGRPGSLVWCGAGRLRTAAAVFELPCERYLPAHDAFVCEL